MTPLALTDLGLITAQGQGNPAIAEALFSGDPDGLRLYPRAVPEADLWLGRVTCPLPAPPSDLAAFDCRTNRLALAAYQEIAPAVDQARHRYGAHRIAVILGTSAAGIAEGEVALGQRRGQGEWPADFHYTKQETGTLARFIAAIAGLSGPAYTINTACSSSGKAFASAARLIAAGFCDAALVGGADALALTTLGGFYGLGALAPSRCNPMSRHRQGTNLGEGAGLFLLQPGPGPVHLLGVGETSDAHHVSAPDPSGAGAVRAMAAALAAAGVTAGEIGYINLHGTATPLNDAMESEAVRNLFGDGVLCSSTKPLTGHTLGAAAAVEAGFCWLALHPVFGQGRLPPHLWDGVRDPGLPELALVGMGASLPLPALMLSNSFAFGGSNVSLVLGAGGR